MTYLQAVRKYCEEKDIEIDDADSLYQFLKFQDSMVDHFIDLYYSTVEDVTEMMDKLRELGCPPEFLEQFRYIK